ncbi:hypothetical protein [Shewanella sp. OMA3-2]|uniref:hypothetical protein n=1 Tax=Shewanella sp. OMA3-2 TaxID=2908650 RepID=UPI001F47B4DA|nr:hypothetical protein [Shewanella sp. OMA3-2]UJF22757.1 hypothetical protein L0B17_05035 [Shewanella sp. OMA3-2]
MKKGYLFSFVYLALLSGCGGSSDTPAQDIPDQKPPVSTTEYNHQVAGLAVYQGALSGASICIDLNQNLLCDNDEPTTVTDVNGHYLVDWKSEVEIPEYYLLANWTALTAASIKPEKVLSANFKNAQPIQAPSSVVDENGQGMLIALPEHNGAINGLTHIKATRLATMKLQGLSTAEIQTQSAELDGYLAFLYGQQLNSLYQLSAAQSISDRVITVELLHEYLQQIIAGQVDVILIIELLLTNIYDQFEILIDTLNLTPQQFVQSNPLDARFIINDELILLGLIQQPIDSQIVSFEEWEAVMANLSDMSNVFTLNSIGDFHIFSMAKSQPKSTLVGIMDAGQFFGFVREDSPNENIRQQECWNSQESNWVKPNSNPPLPIAPDIQGNTLNLVYEGTNVPIAITVEKYDTTAEIWQSFLSASPSFLKLTDIEWPATIYRLYFSQAEDVMCREADSYETYEYADVFNPATFDTLGVISTFYSYILPDDVLINDQANTYTFIDSGATYEWKLLTSPNMLPLIEVTQQLAENKQQNALSSYYLYTDGVFIEVELHEKFNYVDTPSSLQLSFGDNYEFGNHLFQTLRSLLIN